MNTFVKTFVLIFLLFPASAFAATAIIEVDTGKEEINALEGRLVLPESMAVREIQTGNSVILMWVEKPHQTGNIVRFAGITPGGFAGVYPVFTIHGAFTKEDIEQARFESVVALKNDGTGGRVPVTMSLSLFAFKGDTEPPEDFTPVIASDPNIFDGKYFLIFATQDKGSGIKRYEVREGRIGWFREAESPYLLFHKSDLWKRDIYVKAVDNAGNERVAVVPARVHSAWWENYELFAIIIVLGLLAFYGIRARTNRK